MAAARILAILFVSAGASSLWIAKPANAPEDAHQLRRLIAREALSAAAVPKLPRSAKVFQLSRSNMHGLIDRRDVELWVDIPTPDGSFESVLLERVHTMHPSLHDRYPNIRSYDIVDSSVGDIRGTVSLSNGVFSASVASPRFSHYGGRFYVESVDPVAESDLYSYEKHDLYWVFWRSHYTKGDHETFECHHDSHGDNAVTVGEKLQRNTEDIPTFSYDSNGEPKRVLRIGLACTFEYFTYFGSTVEGVIAEYDKLLARTNSLLGAELNYELKLIENIESLIEEESGDGYDHNDTVIRISDAQSKIPEIVNCSPDHCFELGHVVHAGTGGGLAIVGGICFDAAFCGATTGLVNPVGDPFYVDYFAHEIGHQLGMTHTFDADELFDVCGNARTNYSAYEPGSGSTIMAYANLCEQDIQRYTDDYFNWVSLQQALNLMRGDCVWYNFGTDSGKNQEIATSNNIPFITYVTPNVTVPGDTPFRLEVEAFDVDGDPLSFTFEQADLGGGMDLGTQSTSGPMWRSFPPSNRKYRDFPEIPQAPRSGETLSTVDRTLNFAVTVRDGRGGFVTSDLIEVVVDASISPLRVTTESIPSNGTVVVEWEVGGTAALSEFVSIDLTDRDGTTFTLVTSTDNDGSETVTIPSENFEGHFVELRVQAQTGSFFHQVFVVVGGFEPEDDQQLVGDLEIIWDQTANDLPLDIVLEYNTVLVFKVTSGVHGLESMDNIFRTPLKKNETGYITPAAPVPAGYQIVRRFNKPGEYFVRDPVAQDIVLGRILVEEEAIQCQFDPTGLVDCPASTPKPFWL